MDWQISFLNNIQEVFKCDFLDSFFRIFTNLGEVYSVITVLAILVLLKKTRSTGIQASVGCILGLLIGNLLIKNIVRSPRPFNDPDAVIQAADLLIKKPWDYSFPSAHTMHAFTLGFTTFLNNKKAGIPVLILATFIAFSRMYLYVHYPLDIIGGMLIGAVISVLVYYFVKPVCDRYDITSGRR